MSISTIYIKKLLTNPRATNHKNQIEFISPRPISTVIQLVFHHKHKLRLFFNIN